VFERGACTVHVLQVFYHGGLDANNPTKPWADDVLEVVDAETLEVYTITYPPAPPALMTRRYRHVMAGFGEGKLVMAGGQVDDPNGVPTDALSVLSIDIPSRELVSGLRNFTQPGGQADVSTVELKGDAMSFVITVVPYAIKKRIDRSLRLLNLTTNKMTPSPSTLMVSWCCLWWCCVH
jgi:hypothetical protein